MWIGCWYQRLYGCFLRNIVWWGLLSLYFRQNCWRNGNIFVTWYRWGNVLGSGSLPLAFACDGLIGYHTTGKWYLRPNCRDRDLVSLFLVVESFNLNLVINSRLSLISSSRQRGEGQLGRLHPLLLNRDVLSKEHHTFCKYSKTTVTVPVLICYLPPELIVISSGLQQVYESSLCLVIDTTSVWKRSQPPEGCHREGACGTAQPRPCLWGCTS